MLFAIVVNHYYFVAGSSEIRATLAGKDKRKASISADQPRKRLREELTNHDYYEGKLLTRENKKY